MAATNQRTQAPVGAASAEAAKAGSGMSVAVALAGYGTLVLQRPGLDTPACLHPSVVLNHAT